jgi:thioredoxin
MNDNVKLLKFWAEWCFPCKVMAPIVEKVLDEEDFNNVELISINIEEDPDAAREYHIRAIPTLLLVNDENIVINTLTGSASVDQVKEFLSSSS